MYRMQKKWIFGKLLEFELDIVLDATGIMNVGNVACVWKKKKKKTNSAQSII